MSVIEKAAGAPAKAASTIGSWAKAAPFIFGALIFLAIVLAIRFRDRLAAWLAKVPFVRWLAGLKKPAATTPGPPPTAAGS